MNSLPIVPNLDVLEDRGPRFSARLESATMDEFHFQRMKETLSSRAGQLLTQPPHRTGLAELPHPALQSASHQRKEG